MQKPKFTDGDLSDLYANKQYKVALYIRLSKEDANEAESQSVSNQRSLLMAFVREKQLTIFSEYVDDGFTGGHYERPAFIKMTADIERGDVNLVLVKDLSRLGRDYIQTGFFLEKYFPEKRVRFIALLDGIDTGMDSAVNDMTPFKAVLNDLYAKDISKKIRSVKRDQQRKGLFVGGKALYGYCISPSAKNTLVIDEKAAVVVRTIFQWALEGKSCREIAQTLNGGHIPPPSVYAHLSISRKGPYSGLWSSERIAHMLQNRTYLGHMVQGTTQKVSYKSKKSIAIPREQWIVVENTHPAIIDKDDFEQVQRFLASRKRTRTRVHDYMLKGLIFCKECGYPLGVINRKLAGDVSTLYFICRTYQRFTKACLCSSHCIRVETVTQAVIEQLKKTFLQAVDRDALRCLALDFWSKNQGIAPYEIESRRLFEQIEQITFKINRLYNDRLEGILEEADFQDLYQKLKDERTALRQRLGNAQQKASLKEKPVCNPDAWIEQFIQSFGESRECLLYLVQKIEMTADKTIHIHLATRALPVDTLPD